MRRELAGAPQGARVEQQPPSLAASRVTDQRRRAETAGQSAATVRQRKEHHRPLVHVLAAIGARSCVMWKRDSLLLEVERMQNSGEEGALRAADVQDLTTFFGYSEDYCRNRVLTYSVEEMAEAWRRRNPQSAREMWEFYGSTDLYIWELMQWHLSGGYDSRMAAVDRIVREFPPVRHPRALDYGSGIGTTAIRLAEAGYQVTVADVPGKTLDFAKHRVLRRGLTVDIIEIPDSTPELNGPYDVIVCIDVLEHVPNPDRVLKALAGNLRSGGVAAVAVVFELDETYPHHLPSECARFGGIQWDLVVESNNLDRYGDNLYLKGKEWRAPLRGLAHKVWRHTGIHPYRSLALDNLYVGTLFSQHARGNLRGMRNLLLRALVNNPAWIANRGVQVITLEILLGRATTERLRAAKTRILHGNAAVRPR